MNRKKVIHDLLQAICFEVLEFIRLEEKSFEEGWVPSTHIKDRLELNFVAVPQANKQYGQKGWLFAIIARILEDIGSVEYKKVDNRAFYRSIGGNGT